MTSYQATHSRRYSVIRELNTPPRTPRHAANRTRDRLGADAPDFKQLFADLASNPFQGGRAR